MNSGTIWWGQIGNSLRLLTNVTNNLRDCRSAVLQVPPNFPWRQDFYEAVDVRRCMFSGERRLVRLAWEHHAAPGEFILDELCSARIKADYWPGLTYGAYLGSNDDLMMNDYYVWVSGIHDKADILSWSAFLTQYRSASGDSDNRAVFILEYDGEACEIAGAEKINYTIENYDCRVFCLETAAALDNSGLRDYQAELALHLGDGEPELCSALLHAGKALLKDPVKTTQRIIADELNSEYQPFASKTEQQIISAARNAAIVLFFPVLENCRLKFVEENADILSRHLPISNSNGDRITDPYDLEIGSIYYIIGTAEKEFTSTDAEIIRLCRKARNLLAHNKPLHCSDAEKIAALA